MRLATHVQNRPVLAALSVSVLLASLPGSLRAQDATHTEVLGIHRTMFETMILSHDATRFEAVALDQLLLIPPGGILETKDEALAGVVAFDVDEVIIENEVITQHGNTVVVVAKMTLRGEVQPVGRLGPMRTMAVFVRENEEWRLLARSLTPCLPIAIQAGRC